MHGWIRLIVASLLGIVAFGFALGNPDEVAVRLPGGWTLAEVPVFVLVFVPLFFGFILGAYTGWAGGRRQNRSMDHLRDQNRALERELINLRNLPLTNDL
ncbi:MAG: DUF1049 domain-containing protein [Magnetococcales bacterium]|nr:DUF1049 domain-containing protein [Magnetococcales bacterium]